MDKTTVILLLCCMSCSTVLSQTVLDIFHADTPRMLQEGQGLTLTCHFNKGLALILEYKVHWLHEPLVSGDPTQEVLSEQKTMVDKDKHSENYNVDLVYEGEQTNVTLELKNAKPSMDGKYICRAVPTDGGETLEKAVVVTVPANVQYVQLDFDGEQVRSVETVVVERDEGEYGVSCSTGGSNPSASLELYLGDHPVQVTLSGKDGRDVAAEDDTGARRFERAMSKTNLKLSAADDGKTLKCVARAEFNGAVGKVASIPLQIIALEPEIKCDTNASGRAGDKYLKLTCRVNHARVQVDHYSFEIEKTDETITLDSESPNYHALVVEKVDGMENTDDVSLVLYVAEDVHFDSHYYLDVFVKGKGDQKFRHRVELKERDPTGGSSKPAAAYVLCLLLSALVWSL